MSESEPSPGAQEASRQNRIFMKPPRTPEGILDAVVNLSRRLTGQEPTEADIAEARARIMKHFAERE